ncbi:hypothetical protein ACJX0J_019431, partial [Zea mays]
LPLSTCAYVIIVIMFSSLFTQGDEVLNRNLLDIVRQMKREMRYTMMILSCVFIFVFVTEIYIYYANATICAEKNKIYYIKIVFAGFLIFIIYMKERSYS